MTWPRKAVLAVVSGAVGGVGTQVLLKAIGLFQHWLLIGMAQFKPPLLPSEHGTVEAHIGHYGMAMVPLSLVIGGLISGLLIAYVAIESKGHGTDKAIDSFHTKGGHVRLIVPPNSLLSSAALIGSGGCAGREGPIISISGGVMAAVGGLFKRPQQELRLLLVMGMAAGLSAIYRAPIGAALFAIEGLYFGNDLEAGALPWVMFAAVTAWLVNAAFWSQAPLFALPPMARLGIGMYLWMIVMGLLCGLVAAVNPWLFYTVRDGFNRLRAPLWIKPAIGGLFVGLIAMIYPQIVSSGYGWMQLALYDRLTLAVLLPMIGIKMLGMALSVGSGGTGGVFAPTLFVGAMIGGGFAHLLHFPSATVWVLAGMAAMFGASCRCPLTATVMLPEMAAGWTLLPPVAVATWTALVMQQWLTRNAEHKSLYEKQVATRFESSAHHPLGEGHAVE